MTPHAHTVLKILVCATLALLVTSFTTQTIVSSARELGQLPTARSLLLQANQPAAALSRLG